MAVPLPWLYVTYGPPWNHQLSPTRKLMRSSQPPLPPTPKLISQGLVSPPTETRPTKPALVRLPPSILSFKPHSGAQLSAASVTAISPTPIVGPIRLLGSAFVSGLIRVLPVPGPGTPPRDQ